MDEVEGSWVGNKLCRVKTLAIHKRPYVGVSQGTVLGFGHGFGAVLWETVAKS